MTTVFACEAEASAPGYDVPDELLQKAIGRMSAREWCLGGLEVPINLTFSMGTVKAVTTAAYLIRYGHDMCRMTWRGVKRLDDVDGLANAWVESLVTMSTAHDHDDRSRMDEVSDQLMTPLLSTPIAQVREFARLVSSKLEADPRVPFLVWSSFKHVLEPLVLKGPDGEALELHNLLALEVANLVVPRLEPAELVKAMAGALQWRTPETLRQVKTALTEQPTAKPELRGRLSCLFLGIINAEGKEIATVVL